MKFIRSLAVLMVVTCPFNQAALSGVPSVTVGGMACEAVNLNQAFSLQWNAYGVTNLSPTTSLWVTCPVVRNSDYVGTDWPIEALVRVGNLSGVTDTALCIMRRYDFFSAILETTSANIVVPPGLSNGGDLSLIGLPTEGDYYTVTCKLPPGFMVQEIITL